MRVLRLFVSVLVVGILAMGFINSSVQAQAPKGIVVWGARQPVPNLDPSVHYDWSTRTIQQSVYDALLKYVGNPPKLVPWLAESWQATPDAKTWTFHLVHNAVFHNGDPVTAEAVKWSFVRTLTLKQGPAWTFLDVLDPSGIEVVDNYTIVFHLKKPFAPFASYVPWWYIMDPKQVTAHEQGGDYGQAWLREHEAGSGPFKIKEWKTGEYYWLEAVNNYWKGWPHPNHIQGYIFKLVREPTSQRLALEKGQIDIAAGLTPDDFDIVAKEPHIYVAEYPGSTTFGVKMNNQKGYTANRLIRKAISYAMDYQALLNIYKGHAILEDSPFPPSIKGYVSLKQYMYRQDLNKAKYYMTEAGYPNGGFSLQYVYVTGMEEEREIGLIVKDSLSKIGIDVKLVPLTWPEMVARGSKVDTSPDMMAVFVTPLSFDPDAVAFQYYPASWGRYYGTEFYVDPRVKELVEEARSTTDWKARAQMYNEIQRLILADAPEIFGMLYNRRWAFRDRVGGFNYCPVRFTNEVDMYYLYIKK